VLGQKKAVRARVVQIDGFSSHADRNELMRWLSGLKNAPGQVFVTHGEEEAAESFSALIMEKNGWKTTVPSYGDEAELD
jgi:metallo-beta-lactamase family protein